MYSTYSAHILLASQITGEDVIRRVAKDRWEEENVFSPHTIFRIQKNQSDMCRGSECQKAFMDFEFHNYREENCSAVFVCNKVLYNVVTSRYAF